MPSTVACRTHGPLVWNLGVDLYHTSLLHGLAEPQYTLGISILGAIEILP